MGGITRLGLSELKGLVDGRGAALGLGGGKLRGAQSGALAALAAVGVGGFFLVDPGSKDRAWASLPRVAAVKQPTVLQITPAQAVERGVQPSALGAARPFQFTALDATSRERAEKCLAEAIYYEAGSENEDGQRAVAQVVLNRVRHAAFSNSVCGVVYQGSERTTGCQFTFTCDGSLARVPSQAGWRQAVDVAQRALAGDVFTPVGHATHYHASWMVPYWASSVAMVGRIGGHVFYSWKGAAGSAAAFSRSYAGLEVLKKSSLVQPVDAPVVEVAQSLENPALDAVPKGASALAESENSDLLNYKSAGSARGASAVDEAEVKKAIEAAL